MKRVIAMALAALLTLGMSACMQQPQPTTDPTTQTTVPATTQVPTTTQEPVDLSLRPFVEPGSVTLTIGLMENGTVSSYDDNYVTRYLEQETGIHLEIIRFPMDYKKAQAQLLQMVEAGQPLPDIIFGILDDRLRVKLGKEGILADLTPYFETSSYYMENQLSTMTHGEVSYLRAAMQDPNGAIYAFPSFGIADSPDRCAYQIGRASCWERV